MFTGLIQEKGKITKIVKKSQTIVLTCKASKTLLWDYKIGDSMAVNGVCLTTVSKNETDFTVDIMPETFRRSTFSKLKVNDEVNLERALLFNGRIEGHFVAGHVDKVARVIQKRQVENAILITINYPKELQGQIISQGSIAVNGVSLTVTEVKTNSFSISLIPHSKDNTNLGKLKQGDFVNLETDLVGKYIQKQSMKEVLLNA